MHFERKRKNERWPVYLWRLRCSQRHEGGGQGFTQPSQGTGEKAELEKEKEKQAAQRAQLGLFTTGFSTLVACCRGEGISDHFRSPAMVEGM